MVKELKVAYLQIDNNPASEVTRSLNFAFCYAHRYE